MNDFNEENIAPTVPEALPEPKRAYSNGFFSTLTFQVILCLIIVIGMVLLNTFYRSQYSSAEAFLREELSAKTSQNVISRLSGYFNGFLSSETKRHTSTSESTQNESLNEEVFSQDTDSQSSAEQLTSADNAGQGGEQNIVTEGEIPANAMLTSVSIDESFVLPLDTVNVTSPFGFRLHPATNISEFHYGVDLASAQNSNIYAVASGVVSETGCSDGYGNFVYIIHQSGVKTFYAHCESIAVSKGEKVNQGDIIAFVGSTGLSTGYHLHFGASINDIYFNPRYIIDI